MEKQLGNKISFMAEPYLKVPMQGVGTGEIRLNSFGINLGLKYQFGKTRKIIIYITSGLHAFPSFSFLSIFLIVHLQYSLNLRHEYRG